MQLASKGLRAFHGLHAFPANPAAQTSRHIHIPSAARPRPQSIPTPSAAHRALNQTRTLLGRFFTHLTAPGVGGSNTGVHVSQAVARSLHGSVNKSVQEGFSLPVRYALGRPLYAPHLPRPPAVPRGVGHVGLGTARNFSTARPIFQHLVENVPIAGRAFWEVDWDLKMREEQMKMKMMRSAGKTKKVAKGKEMLKPSKKENVGVTACVVQKQETIEQEMDHYFPEVTTDVTTYLLVPLAPTPTSRLPLSSSPHPNSDLSLLPIPSLLALHANHTHHATRVSSLFSRLDAANVWASGVSCAAHGDPSGLCTVLWVTFEGWTIKDVRQVIGEAGMGWCVLKEIRANEEGGDAELASVGDVSDVPSSGLSTPASDLDLGRPFGLEDSRPGSNFIDPSHSFVLPTLDFSASSAVFAARSAFPSPSPSPFDSPFSLSPIASSRQSPLLLPSMSGIVIGGTEAGGLDADFDMFSNSSISDSNSDEEFHFPSSPGSTEWMSDSSFSDSDDGSSHRVSRLGFSSEFESRWGSPRSGTDVWA